VPQDAKLAQHSGRTHPLKSLITICRKVGRGDFSNGEFRPFLSQECPETRQFIRPAALPGSDSFNVSLDEVANLDRV
jgi:hypothetical protein